MFPPVIIKDVPTGACTTSLSYSQLVKSIIAAKTVALSPVRNAVALYRALSTSVCAPPFGNIPKAFVPFVKPLGNNEFEELVVVLQAFPGEPITPPFALIPVTKSLLPGAPAD